MNLCGTQELETERLVLRRFTLADAPAMYHNWASDPEVTKFLEFKPHADVDVSRRVLAEWVGSYCRGDFFQWAIVPKSFGEPIGSIGTMDPELRISMLHVGYCIGRDWWHQGYTSEAFAAVIRFLFEVVGANRIESCHNLLNPNSGKVMQKCGLRYEGTLCQANASNFGVGDLAVYGLVAEDYFACPDATRGKPARE